MNSRCGTLSCTRSCALAWPNAQTASEKRRIRNFENIWLLLVSILRGGFSGSAETDILFHEIGVRIGDPARQEVIGGMIGTAADDNRLMRRIPAIGPLADIAGHAVDLIGTLV